MRMEHDAISMWRNWNKCLFNLCLHIENRLEIVSMYIAHCANMLSLRASSPPPPPPQQIVDIFPVRSIEHTH